MLLVILNLIKEQKEKSFELWRLGLVVVYL